MLIDKIYLFLAGFGLGVAIMYYIASNLLNDVSAQVRLWRKEAIAAKADAAFWQTQYSKDLK
jgi:hypothetical protein